MAGAGSPDRDRYVGRIAPSPTGLLHLGHAATFWTAYERARQHNGTLLLRNEDLDPQRSRPEFVDAMLEDLSWLGITWTPPMLSQSTRVAAYRAAFGQLLATGLVYRCTCSRKDLSRSLEAPHEHTSIPRVELDPDDEPLYDGRCRPAGLTPITEFTPGNYRISAQRMVMRFKDGNLGPQAFYSKRGGPSSPLHFGDFIVWRRPLTSSTSDIGLPSYQLACVVDDAFQGITEVVRGADLLKSTARQQFLQRVLRLPIPAYFHTRLLRDEHGVRLAKRHDALALRTLREQGMTPGDVLAKIAAAQASIAPV